MDSLLFIALFMDGLLLAALVAVGALLWRAQQHQREFERALNLAETVRGQISQQLSAILQISQKFVEAGDEGEIIDTILRIAMQTTGAMGASFVPLDDRGKPMAAIRRGEFPFPAPDAWLEYLASTAVRQTCQQCTLLENHNHACVLLKGPYAESNGIYCYPLRHAGRDLGMLNLYIPAAGYLDEQHQAFMRSLADATALALEGERLRQRELMVLSQLRGARQKADIRPTLLKIVEDLRDALNADLAFVLLPDRLNTAGPLSITAEVLNQHALVSGELPGAAQAGLATLAERALGKGEEISHAEEPAALHGFSAWLVLPLQAMNRASLGVLFVGSRSLEGFNNRQAALARNAASHVSVLVQSVDHLANLEYQAIMNERTRLAREIHDGLAQTLGFLKLQTAQMLGYHERGDQARLSQALRTSYDALAAAYQDARQAIDGLRITPGGPDGYALENWLRQTVAEASGFGGQSPLTITISDLDARTPLAPEVHAQLIRIVQEALSNVRKHARATQAWISCVESQDDLLLEIRDDGRGFAVENVPDPSRYGMRGMRERAELLGADFQVISRPEQGTTVRVRLPLTDSLRLEARE